jgi:hypothetical protein
MSDPVKLCRVEIEIDTPDLSFVVDAAMRPIREAVRQIEADANGGRMFGRKAVTVSCRPSQALIALLSCPGAFEPVIKEG